MNPAEFDYMKKKFQMDCDMVRLELYALTGYEWMVCPKTGANRTMAAQHGLYMQPNDGVDNDHDGKIDEADEFCTKADAGSSPHNFDLARDIYPCKKSNEPWWAAPQDLWTRMRVVVEKHGLISGQSFKGFFDAPHIESMDWRKARDAWRAGQLTIA